MAERRKIVTTLWALGYRRKWYPSPTEWVENLETYHWPIIWLAATPRFEIYRYRSYETARSEDMLYNYISVNSIDHMVDHLTRHRLLSQHAVNQATRPNA